MSALGNIRGNALRYMLYPSIVGSLMGMGYDYFDQRRDMEEDSALKSLDRMARGAVTGLGMGSGALVGNLGRSSILGSGIKSLIGGVGGYYLYEPIANAIKRLVSDAAVKQVEKQQNNYISNYMNTYGNR